MMRSGEDEAQSWLRQKEELERRIRELEARQATSTAHAPRPPQQPTPASELTNAAVGAGERKGCPQQQVRERVQQLLPEASTEEEAKPARHLRTIVGNLLADPHGDNPRYRRLRCANSTLQKELLSLHGPVEVLTELVGFRRMRDPSTGEQVYQLVVEEDEDVVASVNQATRQHVERWTALRGALDEVVQRDNSALEARRRFTQFQKGYAFQIRMDRLQRAMVPDPSPPSPSSSQSLRKQSPPPQVTEEESDSDSPVAVVPQGGRSRSTPAHNNPQCSQLVAPRLAEFVFTELLWNDAVVLPKAIRVLRAIGTNLVAHPHEKRYRLLRLTSATLREDIFPLRGTLEYLIGVLGFEWADAGLALPTVDQQSTGSGSGSDGDETHRLVAREAAGAALLERVAVAAEAKRQAENAMRREAALVERQREKRALEAENERRHAQEAAAAAFQRYSVAANDDDDDDSDDSSTFSNPDGETSEDAHRRKQHREAAGKRRQQQQQHVDANAPVRIPIAEALRRLMGN